jgi:hypothetical protein
LGVCVDFGGFQGKEQLAHVQETRFFTTPLKKSGML